MNLGERIKHIRIELGLTMKEFGEKFNPPASDSIVSRWERGISSPNSKRLKSIAELGNVSARYLTLGNEELVNFGECIKKMREEKGISMRELSRRSAVSQPYLSQLETGKNTNPTSDVIRRLSKGLDVSFLSLLVEMEFVTKEDIKDYIRENI